MHKFAHLADCHLGAYRDQTLREMNLQAFLKALDICMAEGVDFILIAGDMLDSHLPDSGILRSAVGKLREVRDRGIAVYLVYGSHDYSPAKTSMIDILHSAGLFTKVGGESDDPKLEFVIDGKTGAKIAGISAKRMGLEAKKILEINFSQIEQESGFKIFMFHSAIAECNPSFSALLGSMSAESLPKGFDYYASGHVHSRSIDEKCGRLIGFPGPTFGSDYRDLENSASGESHGIFIIDFGSDGITGKKFVEVQSAMVEMMNCDASGKTSLSVREDMEKRCFSANANGKIMLLKIGGELASGRPADIDFEKLKKMLIERGAAVVYLNRNALTAKEQEEIKVSGESKEDIESNLLIAALENFKTDNKELVEKSMKISLELLKEMKEENRGDIKIEYEKRIVNSALKIMGLE